MQKKLHRMKKLTTIYIIASSLALISCNSYNQVFKSTDYEYKYEAAKEYFATGQFLRSAQLLEQTVVMFKGSDKAQESLFMLAMCYYNTNDFETASLYLERYFKTYPKGEYTELARFYAGKASYLQSPDPRLDQTPTHAAINLLQEFLDQFPYSDRREEANDMIFQLQDRLVQKELNSAQLYYNLGNYVGNCANGGSNYEACIITAENALRTYPYTNMREDLYMLILRARYQLACNSVKERSDERFRDAIDEYYGFKNEFPESKYTKEADQIFYKSDKKLNK